MAPGIPISSQAEDQSRTTNETSLQNRWPVSKRLFDAHPGIFAFTVSHTTRAPRNGEIEGVSYYFLSVPEFERLIAQDAFVEYTSFSGHYYGTSKRTIAEQTAKGLIVLLDIEMQGVKQMRMRADFNARYVFIKPPSIEELEQRLRGRGTESEESIQKRLDRAQAELGYSKTPGVYDIIITNDKIEEASQRLEEFIFHGTTGT
ncbi:guanylate kinase [Xylaria sp. FL0933]|nr:guanylate kinase [Xylaria sp. FL0933]